MKCSSINVDCWHWAETENHVHLLVQIHSTLNIADFVRQIKGTTSLWVNDQIRPDFQFKWQGAYGAFSVGRNEVTEIINYIKGQKRHHTENTLIDIYEKTNRPAPTGTAHGKRPSCRSTKVGAVPALRANFRPASKWQAGVFGRQHELSILMVKWVRLPARNKFPSAVSRLTCLCNPRLQFRRRSKVSAKRWTAPTLVERHDG
jgi:hypothetical protein